MALTALVALLAAALAIGCGGSSEAAPLKKAQFVKQGNAICATMQAERQGQTKEAEEQLSDADEAEVMAFSLEPVEKMTEELDGLGVPVGQEKQVEAIISAFEEGTANLEAEPIGLDSVKAFEQADKLAAAYGLTDCAI